MTTTNQEHDHDLPTFDELFPNGRWIYYEGDTPEQFAAEILAEFGFDPSDDACWAPHQFHCPPGLVEAIYGSGRWSLGS